MFPGEGALVKWNFQGVCVCVHVRTGVCFASSSLLLGRKCNYAKQVRANRLHLHSWHRLQNLHFLVQNSDYFFLRHGMSTHRSFYIAFCILTTVSVYESGGVFQALTTACFFFFFFKKTRKYIHPGCGFLLSHSANSMHSNSLLGVHLTSHLRVPFFFASRPPGLRKQRIWGGGEVAA